jgi:hypothetical protein
MHRPILIMTRQGTYKRNTEARSHNHTCRGKEIIITYSMCLCVCSLSYPPCKACILYYIATSHLSGCITFVHSISQAVWFRKINLMKI